MIKENNKFFVLKLEDIKSAQVGNELTLIINRINEDRVLRGKEKIDDHNYIVCNQDEHYAHQVWSIILNGERLKEDIYNRLFDKNR